MKKETREKYSSLNNKNLCNKCNTYKKQYEKYKRKYEIAKSGLTKEEREILIGLLAHEQLKHLIPKGRHGTSEYKLLEELKIKVRTI